MRLLLDTHIFLWALSGSRKLKPAARRLMESADQVYVSSASIWEVAIKVRIGKLSGDPGELVEAMDAAGFVELPVSMLHAAAGAKLPLHHADPFDRMLIAQAQTEPLNFLTADRTLQIYSELVKVV